MNGAVDELGSCAGEYGVLSRRFECVSEFGFVPFQPILRNV